ncbi:MAG TPA: NTP transferase domain-containing protein, partial [Pseudonocardiaceae bacterium]|nr:NTP transferase domain-containing protein [Pseudonocardiaceae bacterium]
MWQAVLLAGGRGSRLGGRHKPAIAVAGRTLLDRALAAVAGADRVVVVGPVEPTERPVRWTREEPPGGGPVAALAAGLVEIDAAEVAVLATDLAGITVATIDRLRAALTARDGAVSCDATGRKQWLIGVWRTEQVRAALPVEPAGASLFSVLGTLDVAEVPELPGESIDV